MASGVSIEILDLRHFASPVLHPVLEAEGKIWKQRLHWDYQTSAKLLMQYLDAHTLPGYAALEAGQSHRLCLLCLRGLQGSHRRRLRVAQSPRFWQSLPTKSKRRCSAIFLSCS